MISDLENSIIFCQFSLHISTAKLSLVQYYYRLSLSFFYTVYHTKRALPTHNVKIQSLKRKILKGGQGV